MEYLVTGATGFIGNHLVRRLVERGDDVVALTRSPSKAVELPDEVTIVEGDITVREPLFEAMSGVDGVFHMAAWYYVGPGRRAAEKAERINVEGTKTVLEAVDELAVSKAVYTSTAAVYGDTGGETVDETYRPLMPTSSVYYRTKWQAHYEVAEPMMADGLPLVVVMPGAVLGSGDKPYGSTREPFRRWIRGDLPMIPRRTAFPFDDVEDAVEGHLAAMDRGQTGEEYIIANEPRRIVDVFELAGELIDRHPPRSVSPRWFKLLATLLSPLERVTRLPEGFEPEMLRAYGGMQVLVDNTKAIEELGLEHRPLEETLRSFLEWELAQSAEE